MELRRPFRAVASAACAASLLETLAAYARGGGHHPGYYASVFLLGLAVASAGALLLGPLGKVRGALAGWVLVAAGLVHGAVTGLLLGAAVFLLAGLAFARRVPESRFGLVLGASFAAASIVGLRLAPRLPADWPGGAASAAAAGFFVLLLPGLLAAARLPAFRSRHSLAVLATALLSCAGYVSYAGRAPAAAPHGAAGPHVFLLVLDTVRADHLSVYGYERDTTPRLSVRVARHEGAIVHPWAFSNGTWTAPSHATLLTGLLPSQHEVHLGTPETESMDWSMPTRFSLKAERTLAERFRGAGYATLAAFANPWLDRIEGMERGFDVFHSVSQKARLPLVGERVRQLVTPSWFLEVTDFTAPAGAVGRELLQAIDA
ncbi:MAG: sulfatase-like hydrolase/transferase, partial [Myxococcales bacterium]|nr:sulfatase-like hydrolase/transferase [Myxococcales bacterium]